MRHAGEILLNLLLLERPGDLDGLGNQRGGAVAKRADGGVKTRELRSKRDRIGLLKSTFQQFFRYSESDKFAITIRGKAVLCDFENVKAKLGLRVRNRIVLVSYNIPILYP